MTKTVIKTLSNSLLCPDTVNTLARVIKETKGSIAYRRHGTGTMDGPCHLVTLLGGAIQIAIPVSAAFVEFRLRQREFERHIYHRKLDALLLRQDGYQRHSGYCVVVCLNAVVIELLHESAKLVRG